jgi:DNA-binding NtrC family response regulator
MESSDDSRTVLVVEDEVMIALDVEAMIGRLGRVPVGPAATVAEALALIATSPPGAALIDENLGGESVLPVARELMRRGIPYAVVSGNIRSRSNDESLRDAPRLAKPVSLSGLKAELDRMLPERSAPQA